MRIIITAFAIGLFFLLALCPPFYLLADAFFLDGRFSLANYSAVLLDQRQMELLLHSLLVGVLTCLLP